MKQGIKFPLKIVMLQILFFHKFAQAHCEVE